MPQNVSGVSRGHTRRREGLKVVIVGDGGCGKTSLLMVYTKKGFPEKYVPSVFEKCVANVRYKGAEFRLNLYDTAGKVKRTMTDYGLCPNRWYPEVHHFCHGVPIILGEETKRKIKAELYLECSAKYKENVEDIFRKTTKRALATTRKSRKAKRRNGFCALL
ncbi:unnamed protein product, partial [Coregonus sp. 'balchen']